jgi:predicted RNase H-like nuclease
MYVAGFTRDTSGWIGVVLNDGRFAQAVRANELSAALAELTIAAVVGVDVPIGLSRFYRRVADEEAKNVMGARMRTIRWVPPKDVLEEPTYVDARERSRTRYGERVSPQSYSIAGRIREVAAIADADSRLHEVHPELAFAAMAGMPLEYPRTSWNGVLQRMNLLESAGIRLSSRMSDGGLGTVACVLDAAASAWSAFRISRSLAVRLPAQFVEGDDGVIWY